jgi:hypothetical protein
MAENIRRELDRLRLPDLQRRYLELLGEPTRCPNRTFLIRKIAEAIEARAASAAAAAARTAEPTPAAMDTSQAFFVEAAAPAAPAIAEPPRADLQAAAASLTTGKTSRKATRAARANRPRTRPQRGRFSSMTVEELQGAYLSIVGRPTGSTDRRYLVWKIREAEKGHVPVGPRETRSAEQEASVDTRILPLRLDAPRVAAIDATWRAQGLKSRMDFFRRALGHYLAHVGAHGAAAMFATESVSTLC